MKVRAHNAEPGARGLFASGSSARAAQPMKRRRIVIGAVACGLSTWGFATEAQTPSKPVRIAWLSTIPFVNTPLHALFAEAMRERGWIEGRHFVIDGRHSQGQSERLPALAAELVKLNPDVFVSSASPRTAAAKNATGTIPILFFGVGDPVASGFVASLARSGGNVTGFGGLGGDLHLKQLDLLLEVAPRATRIGMLVNPAFPCHVRSVPRSKLLHASAEC